MSQISLFQLFVTILVMLVRIAVAIWIFWSPVFSLIFSFFLDIFDGTIVAITGIGDTLTYPKTVKLYHTLDKALDEFQDVMMLVYAYFFLDKALFPLALGLFIYRLIGFIAFEITHKRIIMPFFPNVFRHYVGFTILFQAYAPEAYMTYNIATLAVAVTTKMPQEIYLHGKSQHSAINNSLDIANKVRQMLGGKPLELPSEFQK